MAKEMTAQDKKYQAEDDARTLIRAQEIMADKSRYGNATKEMKRQRDALEAAMLAKRYPTMSKE